MDNIDAYQKDIVNLKSYDNRPYGQTDIGRVRHNNEDSLLLFDPELSGSNDRKLHKVFAVADGVGGRSGGEVASNTTIRSIHRYASAGRYIKHEDLQAIDKSISRGATTLVLAQQLEHANDYLVDSVGDSSPLLVDITRGTVIELTKRDENEAGKVIQVMGPEGNETAAFQRSNRTVVRLREGQTLLLATDGLTKYLDKGRIRQENVVAVRKAHSGSNSGFVRELITMVNVLGGSDNVTIVSIPFNPKYA